MHTLNAYNWGIFPQVQLCHNSAVPSIRPFNIIIGYICKSNIAVATGIVIVGPVELPNSKTHNVWFIAFRVIFLGRFNKCVFFLVRSGTKIKLFELLQQLHIIFHAGYSLLRSRTGRPKSRIYRWIYRAT